MELSTKQQSFINSPINSNTLIEGYSGVGKSTILLKRYEKLCNSFKISSKEVIYIVNDSLKKQILTNQYKNMVSKYSAINIFTINELIFKYLSKLNLPLFENTIDKFEKKALIEEIIDRYNDTNVLLNIDFILGEINFIQENICIKDKNTLNKTLEKELKTYLLIPRKSIVRGLLSFKEKHFIWGIYTTYMTSILNDDIFDEQTFYQSFLRLLYHHYDNQELALTYPNILVDDIQDFTRVQLDIIYHFYDKSKEERHYVISLDELKAKDKHKNFKKSLLYRNISSVVNLDINYRNSKNVFNIIKSNITHNQLIKPTLTYNSNYNNDANKSVLTFFYNKSLNEKNEVFFDRLDLLVNRMKYKLNEILVIFYDKNNLTEMIEQCYNHDIKTVNIFEHTEYPNIDGLTLLHKNDLINCEFKVVILYDADNKKICNGPVNKITNLSNNFEDSIIFYTSISIATDFLIVNTSISEPSHLLLPSNIDYNHFVFEVSSNFKIKSTLNVYRISDFVLWIKENLINNYNYNVETLSNNSIFELVITTNEYTIGMKILDNNIDNYVIENILKQGADFTYIVILDNHHYITFKNENENDGFIRIEDIPGN